MDVVVTRPAPYPSGDSPPKQAGPVTAGPCLSSESETAFVHGMMMKLTTVDQGLGPLAPLARTRTSSTF